MCRARRWTQHPKLAVPAAVVLTALAAAAIRFGTLAHPYLLADNRHYTFYIWKDVLAPLGGARAVLAPAYALAAATLLDALAAHRGGLWTAAFCACTAVAVVPAGLLEFRYFTVPVFVAALQLQPPRHGPRPLLLQLSAFATINAATLYTFCERPFTWPDGSVARFMW